MTEVDERAVVDEIYSAAGELLAAGIGQPALQTCWPAEIRRKVREMMERHIDGLDFDTEAKDAWHGLVMHILRGLQLRASDNGTRADAVACYRSVRQVIGAVRLAADGEPGAVAFVRGMLADAGDLSFVEAVVASRR